MIIHDKPELKSACPSDVKITPFGNSLGSIKKSKKSLSKFLKTKSYFLPNGIPLKSGDIHFNKNYANTLKAFKKNGYNFHLVAKEGTALDDKSVNLSIYSKFPFGERIDTDYPFFYNVEFFYFLLVCYFVG